ncbi:MAG: rRNA maturation RNase YbeY [Cyanobacterium sp. T60_A2020_053]|nr:rRNA maturation RNase YbeY [Cyanobacterium sp. T60_A2020_053]
MNNQYNLEVYIEDNYFVEENPAPSTEVLQWQLWFQSWLNLLDLDLDNNYNYEVSLIFADDAFIQQLNQQYRDKDQATDVLAFASLEDDFGFISPEIPVMLGDIIISVDTAKTQAQSQGHSLMIELAWLASHGFLHLLGWDHPDDESLNDMLDQQRFLLTESKII